MEKKEGEKGRYAAGEYKYLPHIGNTYFFVAWISQSSIFVVS